MQTSDHGISLMEPIEDEHEIVARYPYRTPDRALGTADRSTLDGPEAGPPKGPGDGEDVVARYFSEVRNFALLNREKEQALWRRIERLKHRARRVLLTSPTALSTLTRVWNQVKHGELAVNQVMEVEADSDYQGCEHVLGDAVATWHLMGESETRRARWHHYRAWSEAWSALKCKDCLYDMLEVELRQAYEQRPNDASLKSAWRAWSCVQALLDQAKAHMLQANLRLVIYVARSYRQDDLPLLDLVQEGNLGLMRAIEKFEPERGVKFVTYAYWWIRQAMGRGLIQQARTIRLPSHVVERHHKLLSTARRLRQEPGSSVADDALESTLGLTSKELEDLRMATQAVVPLQQSVGEDGRALVDILPADDAQTPDTMFTRAELKHCIVNCLDALPPREALILRQRFGFDEEPRSLRQIGKTLGLSRERVRQLEKSALERLRQFTAHDALADFLS